MCIHNRKCFLIFLDQSSDDPSMYTGSDNGESGDEDEDIPINEEGGLEILVSGKKLEEVYLCLTSEMHIQIAPCSYDIPRYRDFFFQCIIYCKKHVFSIVRYSKSD